MCGLLLCFVENWLINVAVDEEFPPLAEQPIHKHDLSFRSHIPLELQDSSTRSGTPSAPPGLPLPHGHPATLLQSDLKLSVTSLSAQEDPSFTRDGKSPSLSGRHTPEKQVIADNGSARGRSMDFGAVSLGSPKMKTPRSNQDQPTDDLLSMGEKDAAMIVETAQRSSHRSSRKSKPIKLKLPLPAASAEITLPRDGTQTQNIPVTLPSSRAGSRPGTPLTSMSRNSDSSSARFAKVFRVVGTPKAETPPPVSSAPSVSSVLVSKARSRRASISSPSRPATPGDLLSDCEPNTSESVSRTNSPPFSKVGSAPVRAVSKSQVKKERRLKAKQADAKKEDFIAIPAVEEPVQGPILGRKRKTKKAPGVANEQSLDVSIGLPETAGKPTESAEDSAADKVDQKLDPAKRKKFADKDVRFVSVDETICPGRQ